ncbi:MAG: glutamine--fructose-6-phosphate transaminase (isomerizing) [Candidatus Zixiibacteriota bacterium]
MCGIIGYIGKRDAIPVLIEGLKRLEYRGYDSAGLAVLEDDGLKIEKVKGKIANLEQKLEEDQFKTNLGIAHTRWATHGEPNAINAHPHTDSSGKIAVVHNGIIENYSVLREYLSRRDHKFTTDTDTEVIAHLIEDFMEQDGVDFEEAIRLTLLQLEGTYGLAMIHEDYPDLIYAAKHGSPLIIGIGKDENFIASDGTAVMRYTDRVIYIEEGEIARISKDEYEIFTLNRKKVEPRVEKLAHDLHEIEKSGYAHFMLKEIYEQPRTMTNSYRGRLNIEEGTARLNGLKDYLTKLKDIDRIIITACGTSWHSALIGEFLIEELARIPVEVEYASEFRYRSPILDKNTAVFMISQSGETADTLAALLEAKRKGAPVFGIVNKVGSEIARKTDAGVYIHAGPEIGVASTKAFTSQVMVLTLIAILLGRMRELPIARGRQLIGDIARIPDLVHAYLNKETEEKQIPKLAETLKDVSNCLYLGRGINYPVALEGALKLKEISYIHAEGYPAAEMKHGPIALIDKNMPVVFLATEDELYPKVLSNIEEVRSRGGRVIAIASDGDNEIKKLANDVIHVPKTDRLFYPLVISIPLQLLAYHIALLRGCNVDQPRNLAKSVTVE